MFHRRHHRLAMNRRDHNRRSLRPQLTALEKRALLSTFNVTNTADSGVGSLRYEIGLATSDSTNDTVTFDPSVFSTPETIILTSGQLNLTKAAGTLRIQDAGANLLSVSGNNASQVFYLNGTSASLSGLTITGGIDAEGGGLYNKGGTVTLTNCTVSGNSATNGGGLYNKGGTVTLIRCTISGNSATSGGGLGNFDGTVTLTDCTVSGNSATNGGGLYTNLQQGHVDQLHPKRQLRHQRRRPVQQRRHDRADQLHRQRKFRRRHRRRPGQQCLGKLRHGHVDQLHRQRQLRQHGGGLDNFGPATVTLTNCTVSGNFASVSMPAAGQLRYGHADQLHSQRQLRRQRRRRPWKQRHGQADQHDSRRQHRWGRRRPARAGKLEQLDRRQPKARPAG